MIQRIDRPSAQQGSERENAIAWLDWKEARQARRDKVIYCATVIAAFFAIVGAIAAVVAAFLSGLQLFN